MLVLKVMLYILLALVMSGLLFTLFMVVRKLLTDKGLKHWTLEEVIELHNEYGCSAILENGDVSRFTYDKE